MEASAIVIRKVEAPDAADWQALRLALSPEIQYDWNTSEVAAFLSGQRQGVGAMPEGVLVAIDTGVSPPKTVGFVELSRRLYAEGCATSPVGFLEGWYVVPEYRRRGIGA